VILKDLLEIIQINKYQIYNLPIIMKILEFPELRQTYEYDCGANALQGILAYYGMEIREELIIKSAKTNKIYGTSIF